MGGVKMSFILFLTACVSPIAIDGDTIRCRNFQENIRLAGIDAPDKSCRGRRAGNCFLTTSRGDWNVSREALQTMLRRGKVQVHFYNGSTYGRRIALVCGRGINLNARMVNMRYAIAKPTWTGRGIRDKCS